LDDHKYLKLQTLLR